MIQPMQLLAVVEFPARPIAHEGVVVPTVPQAFDDLQKFMRHLVAQRMFRMRAAVVLRGTFEGRRHRVPAGPPAADEIERGELAGNGEGIAVGRRDSAGEADLRGDGRECGEDRQRLEAVEEMRYRLFVDVEPSATKAKAMPAASAFSAAVLKKSRLTLAPTGLFGWRQEFM